MRAGPKAPASAPEEGGPRVPARVAIVIPNRNGADLLTSCLGSLREQSFESFEVIVVDDGSTDGSPDLVARDFPGVRVVRLKGNSGFSAAVNAGIKTASSEYIALLNNDTEPEPGWLAALVEAADSHRESGLFASKLVSMRDRRVLDGAGDALRWSGLPLRIGHGELDDGRYDRPEHVFGACAAAALYRHSLFDEVGLFDEDFFAYCEDADLSFRAQLAGHRCFYVPGSVVYHVGGASTGGKRSPLALGLGTRNAVLLLVKNLPASLVPRFLPLFALGQLLRVLLTSSSPSKAAANLRGLAGAVRLLPRMLRKREEIQGRRKVPDEYVVRLLTDAARRAAATRRGQLRDKLKARLAG